MSEHIQPKSWFEKSIPQEEGEVGAGMSEQIEAGDGWRLLRPDEVVMDGDEFFNLGDWKAVVKLMNGVRRIADGSMVRRRVPSKPEPIKIRHTLIKCNSFNDVMRVTNQDVSLLVGSAIEARQLADWLNRYADWREVQGETE